MSLLWYSLLILLDICRWGPATGIESRAVSLDERGRNHSLHQRRVVLEQHLGLLQDAHQRVLSDPTRHLWGSVRGAHPPRPKRMLGQANSLLRRMWGRGTRRRSWPSEYSLRTVPCACGVERGTIIVRGLTWSTVHDSRYGVGLNYYSNAPCSGLSKEISTTGQSSESGRDQSVLRPTCTSTSLKLAITGSTPS